MGQALIAWVAWVGASSCIDTNTAVFVDPDIDAPSLTVVAQALGTELTGGFRLLLNLGARASGPSQVTLGSFTLVSADGVTTLVDPLPTSSVPPSPIDVAEDSTVIVEIKIDSAKKLFPKELVAQICAGQVLVRGVIEDSLEVGSTPVESLPFSAAGCP